MVARSNADTSAGAGNQSATRKTSLYRLRPSGPAADQDLAAFVLPKYLQRDEFTVTTVDNGGVEGLCVTGTVAPGEADWCRPLAALIGQDVAEENRTSFGLLLVRTETAVYGLAYGMGALMINPLLIDPGFGIEFAIRCLDQDKITKVRRQLMDARGRSDENSVARGESIRGFGIEQFGEIVTRISGHVRDVPLTFTRDRKRTARVTGDDRKITIQLAATSAGLMADLHSIEEVCARPDPLPEFEFIAHVRPLDPKSGQAKHLDELFDTRLGEAETGNIALAVPGDCRDDYDRAESFAATLAGSTQLHHELDADPILTAVRTLPDGKRLRALRTGRVQMFEDADGNHVLSRQVPADQWLATELSDGAARYFYWQGKWYEIGAEYLAIVESRIAELLARPASVTLPAWTPSVSGEEHDEDWFNKQIAKQPGYVLLDKKNVHTDFFRGGGLEIADALGPQGQLICCKKADRSTAPLNHLFAQSRVAVETLRLNRDVQDNFAAKIAQIAPGHPVSILSSEPVVVLGIMLKDGKPITAGSLFAFAKISLLHTETVLAGMGVRLEIVSISRMHPSSLATPPAAA